MLYKLLVVAALSVAAASASASAAGAAGFRSNGARVGTEMQFDMWAKAWGKTYKTETERQWRMKIFAQNMDEIDRKNLAAGGRTTFGINKFADLRPDEFRQTWASGLQGKESQVPLTVDSVQKMGFPYAKEATTEELKAVPAAFDWRTKGAVTPVKNQGQCGSCWSFSTTGNIEGQWKLAGNQLVGLSEQNLVDCDHHCMIYEGQKSCDAGCDGGLMMNAFQYIIGNGGIDTEASYPYQGVDGTCHFSNSTVGAKLANWTMVSHDEAQMAAWSFMNGPISIAADAAEWQFYVGGVFYLPCGKQLDHGILIVGWGEETDIFDHKMPYWIVKNSWGADWGESGYLKIERGVGECGLNTVPCSSIVHKKN